MRADSRRLVHNSPAKPKAVGDLTSQESTLLSCREESLRGRPATGFARESPLARLALEPPPAAHRAGMDPKKSGYLLLRVTFTHALDSQVPAPRQFLCRTLTAHGRLLPSLPPP
jgi:hypothetical protein